MSPLSGNARWLWPLELPPGVDARFDWIAGAVALDATMEEYEAATNVAPSMFKPTEDDDFVALRAPAALVRVLVALLHETVHYLQVVTAGYTYRGTVNLVRYAVDGWLDVAGDRFNDVALRGRALSGQLTAPSSSRERVRAHLAKLDLRGSSGLTIRSLLEGHAYWVQMKLTLNLPPGLLVHALNDSPGLEYRVAYDAARFVLGDDFAFNVFPLLCNVALCTSDPVAAFERPLFRVQRIEILGTASWTSDPLSAWDALRKEVSDVWVGTSPQLRAVNPNVSEHPVCTPAVDRLTRVDNLLHPMLLASWFANPRAAYVRLAAAVQMPVMLRSTEDGEFPLTFDRNSSPVALSHPVEDDVVFGALAVAAIVRRLFEESTDVTGPPDEDRLSPLRWLTRDSHEPLGIEVSDAELLERDTSHVEELLTPFEGRFAEGVPLRLQTGEELATLVSPKGRIETLLSWHEIFLGRFDLVSTLGGREEGKLRQRFLRELAVASPGAVAYFYFRGDGLSFVEWFGEYKDSDRREFVLPLATAVAALGAVANAEGINAWLQARVMMDVFTEPYARLLLTHPPFAAKDAEDPW